MGFLSRLTPWPEFFPMLLRYPVAGCKSLPAHLQVNNASRGGGVHACTYHRIVHLAIHNFVLPQVGWSCPPQRWLLKGKWKWLRNLHLLYISLLRSQRNVNAANWQVSIGMKVCTVETTCAMSVSRKCGMSVGQEVGNNWKLNSTGGGERKLCRHLLKGK